MDAQYTRLKLVHPIESKPLKSFNQYKSIRIVNQNQVVNHNWWTISNQSIPESINPLYHETIIYLHWLVRVDCFSLATTGNWCWLIGWFIRIINRTTVSSIIINSIEVIPLSLSYVYFFLLICSLILIHIPYICTYIYIYMYMCMCM